MPLENFIPSDHPNLKEINTVDQLASHNGSFILTFGAPYCGHCQKEFKDALVPLCNDKSLKKKGTKCFAVDGTTEDGQKFIYEFFGDSFKLKGFPTNIMCRPNSQKGLECAPLEGEYPKEVLAEIAKKMNIM